MAKKAQKKVAKVELLQVRGNRHILWPDGTHRAAGGTIVRADDPFLEQPHNLQPAPSGSKCPCGPAPDGYDVKWERAWREKFKGETPPDPKEEAIKDFVKPAADEKIATPSDGITESADAS